MAGTGGGERNSARLRLRWWTFLLALALLLPGCGTVRFGWEIEGQKSLGAVPLALPGQGSGGVAEAPVARCLREDVRGRVPTVPAVAGIGTNRQGDNA